MRAAAAGLDGHMFTLLLLLLLYGLCIVSGPVAAKTLTCSAGTYHTCAVLNNKAMRCWGSNTYGELGRDPYVAGNVGDGSNEMGGNLATVSLGTGTTPLTPVVQSQSTCVQLDNSQLKCWGSNTGGALGYGDLTNRGTATGQMGDNLAAVAVAASTVTIDAVATSACCTHACVIVGSAVKCWGANDRGQLGLGHTTSIGDGAGEMGAYLTAVSLGTNRTAVAIAVGWKHTCAVLDDGGVKCWGYNIKGQLGQDKTNDIGDNLSEMGNNLPAISFGTATYNATALAAGGYHTCLLSTTGKVVCWGDAMYGQLGLGSTLGKGQLTYAPTNMASTAVVNLGTNRTAIQIGCADYYSCAVLDNKTIKCWGSNNYGQLGQGHANNLGDGTNEMGDSLPAINVGTGRTVMSACVGSGHVCAVLDNYDMRCWGYNSNGQLGIGTVTNMGTTAGQLPTAAVSLGTFPTPAPTRAPTPAPLMVKPAPTPTAPTPIPTSTAPTPISSPTAPTPVPTALTPTPTAPTPIPTAPTPTPTVPAPAPAVPAPPPAVPAPTPTPTARTPIPTAPPSRTPLPTGVPTLAPTPAYPQSSIYIHAKIVLTGEESLTFTNEKEEALKLAVKRIITTTVVSYDDIIVYRVSDVKVRGFRRLLQRLSVRYGLMRRSLLQSSSECTVSLIVGNFDKRATATAAAEEVEASIRDGTFLAKWQTYASLLGVSSTYTSAWAAASFVYEVVGDDPEQTERNPDVIGKAVVGLMCVLWFLSVCYYVSMKVKKRMTKWRTIRRYKKKMRTVRVRPVSSHEELYHTAIYGNYQITITAKAMLPDVPGEESSLDLCDDGFNVTNTTRSEDNNAKASGRTVSK